MSITPARHDPRARADRRFLPPFVARMVVVVAVSTALAASGASWLTLRLTRDAPGSERETLDTLITIAFIATALVALAVVAGLVALQTRVREATRDLEERNEQLVESFRRVLALREQLAGAEQLAAVGQTAANVAHQVGTPLNLISGYVQVLKEELGADSPLAARLAIIEEQVAKVTSTVRTLLDRSRHMGRKVRTTAGEIVARVCEAMRPSLEAADITLKIATGGEGAPILVDSTNFELALLNLITNAADAMPQGGTLTIRMMEPGPGHVLIEISDTGHGIPKDLLPRIFEPWVSTKQPGRGTGLGLAIARDVISAHGGSISVASEVGRGTTFMIDLPSDAAHELVSSIS